MTHVAEKSTPKQPPLTQEMKELMQELWEIVSNPYVEEAYNRAVRYVQKEVHKLGAVHDNPWAGTKVAFFVKYFEDWFTFLPMPPKSQEVDDDTDGLGKIVPFTWFYLNNEKAFYFLNEFESRREGAKTLTREIFDWTVKFIKTRGKLMDSPASMLYVKAWEKFLGPTLEDFVVPKDGFKSWNEFFTRELKEGKRHTYPGRPIAATDDPSVLVASADSEINFIQTDLTLSTELPVKTREIHVEALLGGSQYAKHFVGGTAVSCVLMPNSYHHYHSPVTGRIVESQEVPGLYNGIIDGEHWFNEGNIGESTTDFSIFEDFHRSYYIIETDEYGHVAMVPVGLNTISGLFFSKVDHRSTRVPPGSQPVPIHKGEPLGYFAYGGSLNILMFEPGVFSSVSVQMGQRLGTMSKPPKRP